MSEEDNKLEPNALQMTADHSSSLVQVVTERPRPAGKYGNMKILLKTGRFLLGLGPDYALFIPTFAFFVIASFFMINYVYKSTQNVWFRGITILICTIQPTSYFITAFVDPGIVTESLPQELNQPIELRDRKTKECKKCNLRVSRKAMHCSECEVCINEYDHHCPWVSKCIGKYNLTSFYVFLSMTPVFMIYCMVAFFICASLNLNATLKQQPI